ncbi:hypothetical protein [Chitinimonas koreensis]|uniref:hypothetical protein n=1 Tax=Chitinimonas koreensis TaxID=356302 RepID=UPI0012F7E76C|nr:hypothetical protein [Chitinimonas koreensis]QNM95433.1 hypothetical protein H9L41_16390 [Chitinimonas koreensis]
MKKALLLLPICFMFGCAARDGLNDLRTSVRNGFQGMQIEVSPAVSNVAKLEDLKLQAVLDDRFALTGFVTYPKSCKTLLTMNARFYSANGTALGSAPATVMAYKGGDRSKLQASFKQIARDRSELIGKVVVEDLKCL